MFFMHIHHRNSKRVPKGRPPAHPIWAQCEEPKQKKTETNFHKSAPIIQCQPAHRIRTVIPHFTLTAFPIPSSRTRRRAIKLQLDLEPTRVIQS